MKLIGIAILLCATACSSSTPQHGGPGGGNGGNGGGNGGANGGGGNGGTGGGNGGSGGDNCSEAAKLVYVIDEDTTLYSFRPNQTDVTQSVFTPIGKLTCATGGGLGSDYTPFSMSVDRNATAWVEYADQSQFTPGPNEIFSVSTANAACTATMFKGGKPGFEHFGMGFVSNAAGSTDETLYIAGTTMVGTGTSQLGTLDVASFGITAVPQGVIQGDPELTGTGLGELWGFYPDATSARISKLSKTDGSESNTIDLSKTRVAGDGRDWAFAFWGGDFWVFLQKQTDKSTIVYHVTPQGLKDSWTTDKHIVGAGVSTCAPTIPIS